MRSRKDAFEKHFESLRSWFAKKNQARLSQKHLLTIKAEQLFESRAKTGTGVPLVVMYHPRFHNLSNTIRRLFIYLYAGEQVKKGFTLALFVSLRSGYILTSDLARAKVHSLIKEKGS